MKVTLIQPRYHNIWEALGLGYIASYCKKHYEGDLEMNFFQGHFDDMSTIINGSRDSDVVGISCTTPTVKDAIYIARVLKLFRPGITTVIGGYHVSAERKPIPYFDHAVVGEGEKAFLDILNGKHSKRRDRVVYGTKLPFSELPPPDRDLIRNDRTIDLCEQMTGERIASFQSSRGCPMNCAFCSEICMSGKYNRKTNPIRTRNASETVCEIQKVQKKYNLTSFKFVDPTFDHSEDHLVNFCIVKRLAKCHLPWECLIHANFMTERAMHFLKHSFCNQINIGCESGSPKILKDVRKGVKIEKIEKVFKWAKNYGIKTRAFFLLGMPNETIWDIWKTERFIKRANPDVVGFTMLCPYPGSDFYDPIKFKDVDWSKTDEYCNDFWNTKHFTNEQLKKIQKKLTKKYQKKLCERQK